MELRDHEGRDEDDILVDVHDLCRAQVGANSYTNVDRDGFGRIKISGVWYRKAEKKSKGRIYLV